MSSERIVSLDTEDKGSRYADNKTLDVETYFKPTELSNTRIYVIYFFYRLEGVEITGERVF